MIGISKLNLTMLGLLLVGYAFLNKGFAYVGVAPLFIGEITLVVLLVCALVSRSDLRFFRSPIAVATVCFVLWQIGIVAFGPRYPLVDTLRDSVIWGYSIFAFLTAALLLRTGSIEKSVEWYGRLMPWFVVWAPIGYLIMVLISTVDLPTFPGTEVPIFVLKPGDLGVHIAGAAAFLALGLHRRFPLRSGKSVVYKEMFWWCAVAAGVLEIGSRNRGGLLSVLMALAAVTVLRPNNRLKNFLIPGLIIVSVFVAFDVRVPIGGNREISVTQITENIASIFVGSKEAALSGTEEWRMEWWESIIEDTLLGEQFWFGRGYGVNLAEVDGFADATENRSPHNGHLTILARSGTPGFVLWIVLIATLYMTLIKSYLVSLNNRQVVLGNINLWVIGYLTAFFVNSSVDVFLEGPQGGIWFWSLVGFAIALTYAQQTRTQRTTRTAPAASRRAM